MAFVIIILYSITNLSVLVAANFITVVIIKIAIIIVVEVIIIVAIDFVNFISQARQTVTEFKLV